MHKLYFKNVFIGKINENDHDFPSFFGSIEFNNERIPDYLQKYIEYSKKSSELMDTNEKKWQQYMEKNEHQFSELIESEDWNLLDKNNQKIYILVPIFYENNTMTWRLNPSRIRYENLKRGC